MHLPNLFKSVLLSQNTIVFAVCKWRDDNFCLIRTEERQPYNHMMFTIMILLLTAVDILAHINSIAPSYCLRLIIIK